MSPVLKIWMRYVACLLGCASAVGLCKAQTPLENVVVGEDFSLTATETVVMDFQTAIVTHKGSIYYAYVDGALRAMVAKQSPDGTVATAVVAENIKKDPHNSPSIGIDAEGYLHWAGNMHNDPMRYYRSARPEDITEWAKLDGDTLKGGMYGQNGVSYGRFVQSRKGTLFYISRQGVGTVNDGWVPGRQAGSIQVYDPTSQRWQQRGSLNYSFTSDKGVTISGGMDARHQTKAVIWDLSGAGEPPFNAYQGYKLRVVFDRNNRMHLTWNVAKNPTATTVSDTHTHLMYAYSDDEGITWKNSKGETLALPITTENGEVVYMEDPAVNAKRMFNGGYITLTTDQRPVVMNWSNTNNKIMVFRNTGPGLWVDVSDAWQAGWPGEAFADEQGWITILNAARWRRSSDNGSTFQQYERDAAYRAWGGTSVDMAHLHETGQIRFMTVNNTAHVIRTVVFSGNTGGGQVAFPDIAPRSGTRFSETAQTVAITCATPGATIRYTTDGSEPTESNGQLYAGPFTVSGSTLVRARAFLSGRVSSRIAQAAYTYQPPDNVPPPTPADLMAEWVDFNSVGLKWKAVSDNSGLPVTYEVFQLGARIAETADTAYRVGALLSGNTYTFTVRAKDAAIVPNYSESSSPLTITTIREAALPKKTAAPNLDGEITANEWEGAFQGVFAKQNAGVVESPQDLSGKWMAFFDDQNIYFYVQITDNELNVSRPNWYENDGIEIYIDATRRRGTNYQSTDFQVHYQYNDTEMRERSRNVPMTAAAFAKKDLPNGYAVEIRLPLASLGIAAPVLATHPFGLDMMLIDNDLGAWQGKLAWFNTKDDSWNNPSTFASASLFILDDTPPSKPVGVSASNVTANGFALTWQPATDNSGLPPVYEIWLNGQQAGQSAQPSAQLTALTPATTYRVAIVAKDAAGNRSTASDPLEVTTSVVTDLPVTQQGAPTWRAFPNPVPRGTWLFLTPVEPANVQPVHDLLLFDLLGKPVPAVWEKWGDGWQIGTQHLSTGLYWLLLETGQQRVVYKVSID